MILETYEDEVSNKKAEITLEQVAPNDYRVKVTLGEKHIRSFYGKSLIEGQQLLKQAIKLINVAKETLENNYYYRR